MKTFLATTMVVISASIGVLAPAQAQRPGTTPLPNPGTPLPTPVPRPSQQIVGQNSGILSTNVAKPNVNTPAGLPPATDNNLTTNP